jgi:hypothetical protein
MEVGMKTLIAVVLLALGVVAGLAQPPYVIWNRIYGGMGDEVGNDIQQVSSGGCVIVGSISCEELNYFDVYLLRIDNNGDTLWTRTFGGDGGQQGFSIKETSDRGFIICGSTNDISYLVKTDSEGNLIWERTHAGNCAYDVIQTADGGYAYTGTYEPVVGNIFVIKTDTAGLFQWHQTYGNGIGYSIWQTDDGGYVIAGQSGNSNEMNVYIVRTNHLGDTLWTRTFGGVNDDAALDVRLTLDGGFIIAGYSNTYNPPFSYGDEILLIRLDALGDSLWAHTYSIEPGVIGYGYWGRSVILTQDGGYLVVGNGTFWIDQYAAFSVALKTDSLGNQEWFEYTGGWWWLGSCFLYGVTEISDGDYIATGSRRVNGDSSGCNVEVIRFSEYTGIPEIRSPEPQSFKLYPAYPNPFNSTTAISFEIPTTERVRLNVYNLLGQEVSVLQDQVVGAGRHEVVWNARGMPSGIYFVRMQAGEFQQVQKLVLLK